jgi:hypothetical protein
MEMGGMFSVIKVREGMGRDDYRDPGHYQHPPGTVAYEVSGPTAPVERRTQAPGSPATQLKVIKPGSKPTKHSH